MLATAAITALLVVLIGATYQGVATALERRRYPHPGRMIEVGDHQLHLACSGKNAPTVILEAPATAMSAAWAWVQTDVAKVTRVCSYDRAGLGWSESGDAPFSAQAVAPELNALLMKAGERPPYVVAGAEFGSALATLYAARFPDDVAALVVVNPPGEFNHRDGSKPSPRFVALSPWLARMGVLRVTRTMTMSARELPQPAAGAMRAFLNRPDHLTRAGEELARWDEVVMLSEAVTPRQALPVTQVEVEGNDRIALLANRRNAQDIANAVVRAAVCVRSGR